MHASANQKFIYSTFFRDFYMNLLIGNFDVFILMFTQISLFQFLMRFPAVRVLIFWLKQWNSKSLTIKTEAPFPSSFAILSSGSIIPYGSVLPECVCKENLFDDLILFDVVLTSN